MLSEKHSDELPHGTVNNFGFMPDLLVPCDAQKNVSVFNNCVIFIFTFLRIITPVLVSWKIEFGLSRKLEFSLVSSPYAIACCPSSVRLSVR